MAAAGSIDNYMTIQFFFEPDGSGYWGSTRTENGKTTVAASYLFDYTLTGEVNVRFVQKKDGEVNYGFFTTDYSGQVFVCGGTHYIRDR